MTITTASTGLSTTDTQAALAAGKAVKDSGLPDTAITQAIQRANSKIAPATGGYPTIRKLGSNPLFVQADQSANSIMWAWMVDMSASGESGFALFWSTDHSGDAGSGIWLATSPTPEGPWTQHGKIFQDTTTGGEQTETASVMWNEVDSRWQMYYQLKNVPGYTSQLTLLATADTIMTGGSPSTWTIVGPSAVAYHTRERGDGHTGYFKPFRYKGGWYAHGLYGGTDNSRRAFWQSHDNGVTWMHHPEIMQNNQHCIDHFAGFDEESWMVKINGGAHFMYNGELWVVAIVGGAASGGGETLNRTGVFKVMGDGVTLSRGVDVTQPLQAWEDATTDVDQYGSAVSYEGRLFVTYRSGGADGGFGLVEIV